MYWESGKLEEKERKTEDKNASKNARELGTKYGEKNIYWSYGYVEGRIEKWKNVLKKEKNDNGN